MRGPSHRSRLLVHTLLLLALLPLAARAEPPDTRNASTAPVGATAQLSALEHQLEAAEGALRALEAEHSQRPEPTAAQARARRFSDGEFLSLLGHHAAASVLFYDLVSEPAFRESPQYDEALYLLADALYSQGNLIGARVYLRELLARETPRFREVLARYLESSARLDLAHDVDAYVEQARRRTGTLAPEVAYAWGKSLFLRTGTPLAERLARARAVFAPLAADARSPVQLPSAYFLGVCHVQAGQLEEAVSRFRATAALPVHGERDARVRELAHLALARVLHELGRHGEAVDRYQEIPRESPLFADALYETAWAQVRQGEHARAKATVDLLLQVAAESTLAPEARLLRANLLLRLKRYGEASDAYTGVVQTFAPVRDELDATLAANQDPVAYFDAVLARHARDLDASELLPEGVRRYARIPPVVRDGLRLVADLESSRQGLAEARQTASRIEELLTRRGPDAFPDLQEGIARADAADASLARLLAALVELEAGAVDERLTPPERAQRERLLGARRALEARLTSLPTTSREVDERRTRLQARVDAVSQEALRVASDIQSVRAGVAALERWVVDTRSVRTPEPQAERELLVRLERELETLAQLETELGRTRAALVDERARAGLGVHGEERIREGLVASLEEEHRLLQASSTRSGADAQALLARLQPLHARTVALRARAVQARADLRAKVHARGERLRAQVTSEVKQLEAQERELEALSGPTRAVAGRVAFDAFRSARGQFAEHVQRADVGLLDVALTRKADHTAELQRVAAEKARTLRELDLEHEGPAPQGAR